MLCEGDGRVGTSNPLINPAMSVSEICLLFAASMLSKAFHRKPDSTNIVEKPILGEDLW